MATKRTILDLIGFDLKVAGNFVRVPTPRGVAAFVAARTVLGDWSNAGSTLAVRHVAGGGAYDFASAKSIAAGGGLVRLSAEEMAGVGELEISLSAAEVAAGECVARIVVDVEEESQNLVGIEASGHRGIESEP